MSDNNDIARHKDAGDTHANCPTCGGELVWRSSVGSTMIGGASPPGHDHDPNCHSRAYRCKNGHEFKVSIQNRCPVPECDWVGKSTCYCHPGIKVKEWPSIKPELSGRALLNDASVPNKEFQEALEHYNNIMSLIPEHSLDMEVYGYICSMMLGNVVAALKDDPANLQRTLDTIIQEAYHLAPQGDIPK